MAGPRLLLLDRPTAGLAAATDLLLLLHRLNQDLGVAMLLAEDDLRGLLPRCDLVHVLAGGQIVASGPPEEVSGHPDIAGPPGSAGYCTDAGRHDSVCAGPNNGHHRPPHMTRPGSAA